MRLRKQRVDGYRYSAGWAAGLDVVVVLLPCFVAHDVFCPTQFVLYANQN
jgi:hypothetical protein